MRNKYRRIDIRVDWLELVRYVRCSRITSVSPNGTAKGTAFIDRRSAMYMNMNLSVQKLSRRDLRAGQPNVSVGGPMLRWYCIV